MGAPSLRFQEAAPPPDLATRPPAAAPPTPPSLPPDSDAAAKARAAQAAANGTSRETSAVPSGVEAPLPDNAAPARKSPAPILQDDARPIIHPEDFLPYFQIPGSARQPDVTVIVPLPKPASAPSAQPSSSATYTQTPQ